MTKRMLIDDTQPEETRVVIVNGNKVEDVEFESSFRKQIKGNIYTAKVIRVEPSLQAAFIDYGGNKHGFLAFGEIHPDYYNVSPELLETVEREADEIIERKKQYLKEREEQRERVRAEKKALYEARLQEEQARAEAEAKAEETQENPLTQAERQNLSSDSQPEQAEQTPQSEQAEQTLQSEPAEEVAADSAPVKKKRKYTRRKKASSQPADDRSTTEDAAPKTLAASNDLEDPSVSEDVDEVMNGHADMDDADVESVGDEEDFDLDSDTDFEMQRRLIRARKLYHYSTIQDVIKEGQTLLVQIVKEERGNKGAACTTYLSLAGRYCVLMPNRIKSGGVSRKITNAADRKRLKEIVKNLPLGLDMSLIIRTAGEDKTKADIVRDYNYLIRAWNQIRLNALKNKAPSLIFEEGNLIKRALRDMCTNDVAEVIVDGDEAFKVARDFVKILSPSSLRKIKSRKPDEMPVFQRFQVESQLDKLHNPVVQLESGGYLVINPTEALVSIDVNSGRATREKDIEETALKTNLEAADEIAKQLKMRNLAGLVVIDFIDMEDPKNNTAVEKRMKEAMKNDRSRIQIAKMSCFGLLEISRQRIHSSFMESNYQVCPHCHGQGVVRTTESGAMLILRALEEEGVKNRSSKLTVFVPDDIAVYLLNQKRKMLWDLEERYRLSIIISADREIKNVCDFRLERSKSVAKQADLEVDNAPATAYAEPANDDPETAPEQAETENADLENTAESEKSYGRRGRRFRGRRGRLARRYDKNAENRTERESSVTTQAQPKADEPKTEGKKAWWRKLIG